MKYQLDYVEQREAAVEFARATLALYRQAAQDPNYPRTDGLLRLRVGKYL